MTTVAHNLSNRQRRLKRMHRRVKAIASRPKLVITRTNRYIDLQVIGENGYVQASESDIALVKAGQLDRSLTKTERAAATGKALAAKLQEKNIKCLAVDRGAYKFHGRIKAAVEAIRENGIEA
ncbi:50S ribosomal protein L18 [bacterium]|nr:50S ribosomal protein L18 [bacterium]